MTRKPGARVGVGRGRLMRVGGGGDKNKIILCVDTSGHHVGKLRVRSKERGEQNRSRSYLL